MILLKPLSVIFALTLILTPRGFGVEELLPHGDFESSGPDDTEEPGYRILEDRGIDRHFPNGEAPSGVIVNAADGWKNKTCRFEYVFGNAGSEVYSGSRAVRITSPEMISGISIGGRFAVKEPGLARAKDIELGRVYRFSFHAKGAGEITVQTYTYDAVQKWIAHTNAIIEPEIFELNEEGWTQCSGTFVVKDEAIANIAFALRVKGDATLDNVTIQEQ